MLAFSCYTGNAPLVSALLDWGADHERALALLSPPAPVGIRWDDSCVELLHVSAWDCGWCVDKNVGRGGGHAVCR